MICAKFGFLPLSFAWKSLLQNLKPLHFGKLQKSAKNRRKIEMPDTRQLFFIVKNPNQASIPAYSGVENRVWMTYFPPVNP